MFIKAVLQLLKTRFLSASHLLWISLFSVYAFSPVTDLNFQSKTDYGLIDMQRALTVKILVVFKVF